MATSTNYSPREKLENNFNQIPKSRIVTNKIFAIFKVFFQQLSKSLRGCDEPRIWVTFEKSNQQKLWHAYDPVTGRYLSVDSETEMRVWIEKRYYQ